MMKSNVLATIVPFSMGQSIPLGDRGKTTLVVMLIFLCGCNPYPVRIQTDFDQLDGTRIFRWQHRIFDSDWRTPLRYIDQAYVKRISLGGNVTYEIYDILVIEAGQFSIDDPVVMVLGNEVIRLPIRSREHDMLPGLSAEAQTAAADSTIRQQVIMSLDQLQVVRLRYSLTEEQAMNIKSARSIRFQYRSGPYLFDVKVDPLDVEKLREWAAASVTLP